MLSFKVCVGVQLRGTKCEAFNEWTIDCIKNNPHQRKKREGELHSPIWVSGEHFILIRGKADIGPSTLSRVPYHYLDTSHLPAFAAEKNGVMTVIIQQIFFEVAPCGRQEDEWS